MKTNTPLSIALAALLAGSLYATPWGLMWALDLAPPEFGIETIGPSDATFVAIDVGELGLEEELEDPFDMNTDGTDEDSLDDDVVEEVGDPGPSEGDDDADGAAGTAEERGEGAAAVAGASKAGAKKAPVKRRRRRPEKCQSPHPHVRTATDGVVEIDRAYVERMTKNLKTFMTLGYSRPYREDGVKGWYISGFGCASPVFKAGFRRKDVLLSVNGKNTRNVAGVFLLYLKLKKKSDFEVELMRRGKPRTLRFRVVSS